VDVNKQTIGAQMRSIVEQRFVSDKLRRHALHFIEEKLEQSVRFGMLTLLHYELSGGSGDEAYRAAAAVELFILATDIIDDLQDQDVADYVWMKVPQPEALHTAVSLLTLSQQALLSSTAHADRALMLAQMMNEQLLHAANGQMSDIMNEADSEESYLSIVKQKSAAIMVFACMAGVMLAGKPWNDTVAKYATEMGIAAQIRNDLRDLTRWDEKSDFLKRKRTLLTLFLIESDLGEDRWIADYFENRIAYEDIKEKHASFEAVCERTGTLLYGAVMARLHANNFEELLNTMELGVWRERFLEIVN